MTQAEQKILNYILDKAEEYKKTYNKLNKGIISPSSYRSIVLGKWSMADDIAREVIKITNEERNGKYKTK